MSFNPTKQSNPKVIPFTGVNWVQFKQSVTAAFKFAAVYELVVGVRTHYSDFEPLIEEIPQSVGTGESATTVTEKQIKKNDDGTYVLKEYERGMNKHLLTGTLCKPGDLITTERLADYLKVRYEGVTTNTRLMRCLYSRRSLNICIFIWKMLPRSH